MALSPLAIGCANEPARSPELRLTAPLSDLSSRERIIRELTCLRGALDRVPAADAPSNGWNRLEKTEWPFFALRFFADAAMRLADVLPDPSKERQDALNNARWAIDGMAKRGIPGSAAIAGLSLIADGHRLVALECFARVARSDEDLVKRRWLAIAFESFFRESPTGILPSYRSMWWTLDGVAALAGLALHEGNLAAAKKWEATVRTSALDVETGLIRAAFNPQSGKAIGPPRGSALMLAIPDLQIVSSRFASEQWQLVKTHLVRTLPEVGITGIREYPEAMDQPANVDSGRIFQGLGESASGLGLTASVAMGDHELAAKLFASARMVAPRIVTGPGACHSSEGLPLVGRAAILRAQAWRLSSDKPRK